MDGKPKLVLGVTRTAILHIMLHTNFRESFTFTDCVCSYKLLTQSYIFEAEREMKRR